MELNFTEQESQIALNEKRLEYEYNRYQNIQSKIGYLSIIYSIMAIYVIQLIQFSYDKNNSNKITYAIAGVIFIVLIIFSIVNAISLLIPKEIAYIRLPKEFYNTILSEYKNNGISEDELDAYIKATYIDELEKSVKTNFELTNAKSSFYSKAFQYGLLSLIPYIICLGIYITDYHNENEVLIKNYKEILKYQDSISKFTLPEKLP